MTSRQILLLCLAILGVGLSNASCSMSGGDPLSAGTMAPDFKVHPALTPASSTALSDFKGKVVVVDFWATWCAPCRQLLPHVQSLWTDYKDKGVQVMAITEEPSAKVLGFCSENKFDFPVYTDESKEANSNCSISGLPTTMVVGKDGKIVYSTMGIDDNTPKEIDDAVAAALK